MASKTTLAAWLLSLVGTHANNILPGGGGGAHGGANEKADNVCRTETASEAKASPNPLCGDAACGWGATDTYKWSRNKECIFPFTYKGVEYDSCTSEDHWKPWCPTQIASGSMGENIVVVGSGHWGNCADSCFASHLSFSCSKVPTCCSADQTAAGSSQAMYRPAVVSQAAHIVGVHNKAERDAVMKDVFSLDGRNQLNTNVQKYSMLTTMFLADLNPVEVGFLLNDTRVTFVECNGIVSGGDGFSSGSNNVGINSASSVSVSASSDTGDASASAMSEDARASGSSPTPTPRDRRLRGEKTYEAL